jgi:hypothetical protein
LFLCFLPLRFPISGLWDTANVIDAVLLDLPNEQSEMTVLRKRCSFSQKSSALI